MHEVQLTESKAAIVDDADAALVDQYKWYCSTYYAFKHPTKSCHHSYMHRLIMGAKKGQIVDHINGDKLDNRRSNLRFCTPAQNNYNSSKHKRNTSGYKGVFWNGRDGKWLAQAKINQKQTYLGQYETREQAALYYNLAAIMFHGEFARLNVIECE
jgi:hypothetical protein